VEDRHRWGWLLGVARHDGRIAGSEYEPVPSRDLGMDEKAHFGVQCGVGAPQGPKTIWFTPRRMPREKWLEMAMRTPGAKVWDHEAGPGLGRLMGVAQHRVWPLIRPHDCRWYTRHRAGLSPLQHVQRREQHRVWLLRALVAAVLGLLVFAAQQAISRLL
jgi:hypothetical protein